MPAPALLPDIQTLYQDAVKLLQELVGIPSFSKEEGRTADALYAHMEAWGLAPRRTGHNVWAYAQGYQPGRPTLVLLSHHDTVRPNAGYTRNPHDAAIEQGILYGLGASDAGGALVALLAAFRHVNARPLSVNVMFIAAAEEEISGPGGIELVLPHITRPHLAIVGEPTQMQAAIAEKGLLVIDAVVEGKAGHAARSEGINAIYLALDDLLWLRDYRLPRLSDTLGQTLMQVTVAEAGRQHNVVPDACRYTIDVRLTDAYTHEQVLALLQSHLKARLTPRSLRLRPTATPPGHPVQAAIRALGLPTFGSATLSDQALLPFASLKLGPGDSARSHTADEHIYLKEIAAGIAGYVALIEKTYFQRSVSSDE